MTAVCPYARGSATRVLQKRELLMPCSPASVSLLGSQEQVRLNVRQERSRPYPLRWLESVSRAETGRFATCAPRQSWPYERLVWEDALVEPSLRIIRTI